jgi:hypothetical protein
MFTNTAPKCKLSKFQKEDIKAKAQKFLDEVFKAVVLRPAPADARFNYMVDVSVKWHGAYLIFVTKYACPGPVAMSPFSKRLLPGSDTSTMTNGVCGHAVTTINGWTWECG